MDRSMMGLLGKACWLVTGLTALAVGIGAMGVDVEGMLHLASMGKVVRYGVGVCGAYSLIMLAMSCCSSCASCD